MVLKFGFASYGSDGRGNAYIHVRADDDDRETSPERHTFSMMPLGIAFTCTAVLIYALLVIQHLRTSYGAQNHPDVPP